MDPKLIPSPKRKRPKPAPAKANISVPNVEPLILDLIGAARANDRKIEGALIAFVDIDELKQSLLRTQAAREYAEAIVETVWEPLLVLDERLRVQTANKSFCNTFGLSLAETKNALVYELGGGAWDIPGLRELLEERFKNSDHCENFIIKHTFSKLGYRVMQVNARRLIPRDRVAVKDGMILLALNDVTDQKRAEIRAVEKNETFLREMHHRVKNNLQVISSLLNMQSRYLDDPKGRAMFLESQNRVKSIALIHEKMCLSEDMIRIDFCEYVRSLCSYLLGLHAPRPDAARVDIRMDPVKFTTETAIPVSLIINELVTNSLKHAFAGRSDGEIRIGLKLGSEGEFILKISDNGVGPPAGIDLENSRSLGLQLVQLLTEQLEGRMRVRVSGGVAFEIRFRELHPPG